MLPAPKLAVVLRGVIFDLDGTLGDTLPVCFEAFRRVFRHYLGVEYTDGEIRAMFGPTEEGILDAHIPADGAESLQRYLDACRDLHHLAPTPFAGIPELLDALEERNIPVAVVTGKGVHSAALSLDVWGIADRFTHVAAGADHGNIKDENMARVIEAWSVDPQNVVSVGDAPSDVGAARSVGAVAVGAAWASTTDRAHIASVSPDVLFDDVPSFAAWLLAR